MMIEHRRRVHLAGTESHKVQVKTLRVKLFRVAARVTPPASRVVFHLRSSYPYQSLFVQWAGRLRTPPQYRLHSNR